MSDELQKVEQEAVYFLAVRSKAAPDISAAMKALNEAGLLPEPGEAPDTYHAVVWYRPYGELTANDHDRLRGLGLGFDDANRIVTVAWENRDA